MNQELLIETRKKLQAIFSSACDQPLIIYVGKCTPLLIQGLKQNISPSQKIVILNFEDPVEKFIGEDIYYINLSSFNLFLETCSTILKKSQELRYRIILEESVNELLKHQLDSVFTSIQSNITELIRDINSERYRTEPQFHNFFMNIPALCLGNGIQKIKDLAKGKTVVVLGAGPSLKEKFSWLKKNRNNIFLIAAGSISSGLFKNDIHPDLYVETDHRSPTHWEHVDPSNYNLAATTTITAGLAERFKQVFWMEANSSHREWIYEWEKKFCPDIDRLKSIDQNTGLTATGVAEYCGAKSIILIGIDLCLSPEGFSHSECFHRGKDKVEISTKMQRVKNNRGEDCPTIFGGFINGFNQLITECPNTQFIQTSENGVCLDNAQFKFIDDCLVINQNLSVPELVKDFNFKSIRPTFRELKKSIQSFNGIPENILQQKLLDIININSIIGNNSVQEEFQRQKSKYLEYTNLFQECLFDIQSHDMPILQLHNYSTQEMNEVGVPIDWQKEYTLADLPLTLETASSKHWRLDWQRVHMMQLLTKHDNRWQATAGQFELNEKAAELINQCFQDHKGSVSNIVCLGVWDGNYINLLASKFPSSQFFIIEPDIRLLKKILQFIPLASKLPRETTWLQDISELKINNFDNTVILCPDKNGEVFPKLGQMHKSLLGISNKNKKFPESSSL